MPAGQTARSLLIVEDSETLALGLQTSFEFEGYDVRWASDGEVALRMLQVREPDLMILDLMLPTVSGVEVLRRYRAAGGDCAVLVLSAREAEADKVQGFRNGADDYVVKPVGVLELLARADALLRRTVQRMSASPTPEREAPVRFGEVVVDPRRRMVTRAGMAIPLTPREYDLLMLLMKADGAILSRQRVMEEVWPNAADMTSRSVDQHVARLRQKIEPDAADPRHILTARNAGYRFAP